MFISTDDNKIYKISFSGNVLSCFSQSRFDNIVSIKANHGGDHLLIGGSANEILILKVPDDSLAALPANELYTHTFDSKYKISKSCYFPNKNCFVIAVLDKTTLQYFMKTFDLRENQFSEIKKDKMRYKIADVKILHGHGDSILNFMCIATERKSEETGVKSVLKVHRMIAQFC